MSLKLPQAPAAYDRNDQAQMRGAIERADLDNRKTNADVDLRNGTRLVFYDKNNTAQFYTGRILGGLVRSDLTPQGLTLTEQANARANIGAGTGSGSVSSIGIGSSTLMVTGSPVTGSGAITVDLPTTGVTAGAYTNPNVTVDAYGRLTAVSNGGSGAGLWIGTTPPISPATYPFWWDSDAASGKLKIYYPDVDSSQWVDATPTQQGPPAWSAVTAWATATSYVTGPPASVVTQGGSTYVCILGHTSGTFATDLAAGKWVLVASVGATGPTGLTGIPTAGGRLTLTSNTPVMTADVSGATAVYYTPYLHDKVPIYSGSAWGSQTFTQLTLNLDASNYLSGNLYDVFVWNNAGTISIGTGPTWSSTSARGTGVGTTELQMLNGIWTNKNSITLKNGAGAGTSGIPANQATYVGTFCSTANGQTGMQFSATAASNGANPILGVYNAYNRFPATSVNRDSTLSWTYNSATIRQAHGSSTNQARYVDGLAQSSVMANYTIATQNSGGDCYIGLARNSVSAFDFSTQITQTSANPTAVSLAGAWAPTLGLNQIVQLEGASGTATFFGAVTSPTRQLNALNISLDM